MSILMKIIFYSTFFGKVPFKDWQSTLDKKASAATVARLVRIRLGNFGDCIAFKGRGWHMGVTHSLLTRIQNLIWAIWK